MLKKYKWPIIAGVVLVLSSFLIYRSCRLPNPNGYPVAHNIPGVTITQDAYTPPIVHLPFVKDKPPIPIAKLSVPVKRVSSSIVISSPGINKPIEIVIDKKGKIIPVDAPIGSVIKITKWRDKIIGASHHFSLSFVQSRGSAIALAYDPLRIWRFRLGLDAGIYTDWKSMFAGVSARFHAFTINPLGLKIYAVAGYELSKRVFYFGGSISL